MGTIEYRLGSQVLPAANTTPESLDLHRLFAELDAHRRHARHDGNLVARAGAAAASTGLNFHTAVFTNLTRDHLDFHRTMEDYFAAKRLLFTGSGGPPPRYLGDQSRRRMGPKLPASATIREVLCTGSGRMPWCARGTSIRALSGLRFEVVSTRLKFEISSPLIGKINVYNILAACGAAMTYQIPPEMIARGIAACAGVPGRFERVDEGQPFAWWWIIRIPTTRCEMPSPSRAR